ncbi:Hyperpolarization-activated voltage-gated potassium channel [uncultured archaeon]|nr:Hyperpolarization-activated voltage-gated potassium channel [uncultured archaeon]
MPRKKGAEKEAAVTVPEGGFVDVLAHMSETRKKLYFAIFLVVIVFIIGAYAYEKVEGWNLVTAVYFMSSTMTTVGYGDVTPQTETGRILTIFFMWIGVSLGLYLLYTISEFREKEVDDHLKRLMGRLDTQRKKIRL